MKIDKVKIENTLKLLRRGKWEMGGEEALAFYQCFEYWVRLLNEINKAEMEANALASAQPVTEAIKEKKILNKKSKKA